MARLAEHDAVITALEARVESVAMLEAKIDSLRAQVAILEVRLGKNSQNSSKPPSTDAFVKPPPRSLRRPSGRKPGKQPGDPGMRLQPVKVPDVVLVHEPGHCAGCGLELAGADVAGERSRQVFDLPEEIRLHTTEHRVRTRRCSCGHLSEAGFPAVATAATCYGPRIQGFACYLMDRQHLPVARTTELLADCVGAPVSTGWLASLQPRAKELLEPFMEEMRARLRGAAVAHFDETGGRVNGMLNWVHVACTDRLTLLHLAPSRGHESMEIGGVLGHGFAGVAVHDGLASYRHYEVEHASCGSHLLRELAGIAEATGQQWPTQLQELMVEMLVAVDQAKTARKTHLAARVLTGYKRRYKQHIAEGVALNPLPPPTGKPGRPRQGPARALLHRLDIYQDDVLRFAYDFAVPFSNNQAERDVRMVKLQQKISGCWRSQDGAEAFLDVRSYVATATKQGKNAAEALRELFTGNPWLPATP